MPHITYNEEQIISCCPIDGAISVWVDSRYGSYRSFVYITTPLLRDASWILILHCGTPELAQRHLYCLTIVLLEPHCCARILKILKVNLCDKPCSTSFTPRHIMQPFVSYSYTSKCIP